MLISNLLETPESEDEGERQVKKITLNGKKTSRAKSLEELQQRLQAITSKKKLTYKEKLTKKSLKNRMKKKNSQDEMKCKQKVTKSFKVNGKKY